MEQETLTERQLASRMKSRNYIPPDARNLEKVQELRKARKQAKREHTIQREATLEARRLAELDKFESAISKDLDKTTKNTKYSKSLKVVRNMHLLMNFILSNPRMLKLLDEFNSEFISYLIGIRNKINMVLKLDKENKTTYKQRKELKRPKWARMRYSRYYDSDLDSD